jgi:hypothetical protein
MQAWVVLIGMVGLLAIASPAAAQQAAPPPEAANAAFDAAKAAAQALGPAAVAEIQKDLIWTGDLNTLASGEFGRRSFEGIRAFQRRIKAPDTGILKPAEREALHKAAAKALAATGFKTIEEQGVRVGYPARLATKRTMGRRGPKFASPDGKVTVDILSYKASEEPFEALFERLKAERPGRDITYSLLRPDAFVITGTVDGMAFYMRFLRTEADSRGFILGWDPKLSPGFDRIPIAMAVSLGVAGAAPAEAAPAKPAAPAVAAAPRTPPVPLAAGEAAAPRAGTGILVSPRHVLTSARLVAGCLAVEPAGEVLAGDRVNDLALVQLAQPAPAPARPAPLRSTSIAPGEAMTAMPLADGAAPTGTRVAALSGAGEDTRRFTTAGPPAEAALFDAEGRLAGLATPSGEALKPAFLAAFLRSQGVAPAEPGSGDAAAALLRLGCDPGRPLP